MNKYNGTDFEYELYKDTQKEWRWKFRSLKNGNIIAISSESYKNKKECRDSVDMVQSSSTSNVKVSK